MTIYSIEKITAEAVAAAKTSSNVNDVCPYPFSSAAGYVYRNAFEAACKHVDNAISDGAALEITHSLDQFEAVG